jgi:hypothetical protein
MVEKEDGDLFVRLVAHIDASVETVRRLVPTRLPRTDLEPIALAAITVFDGESVAPQDHGYPMKWVTVPVHGLPGREAQPTDEGCSALKEPFLRHR